MSTEKKRKRVVILGAGFGGVYTFKALHKRFHKSEDVELVLVNETNYFLFTPLLHEVATGNIAPENIIEPLRKVLGCIHSSFYLGKVDRVALKERKVYTNQGELDYDYLVLALGAETNFRDVPGAKEHCFELKSLPDAVNLKNKMIRAFERASLERDPSKRAAMLHFVVIGGGPTGVELAAEMADFCFDTFAEYYDKEVMNLVKVTLVQKDEELLKQFSPSIRKRSLATLKKKGVDIHFGVYATEVGSDSVTLSNEEVIQAETIVWTAGVKPTEIAFDTELERNRGRILVNDYIQVPDHPEVFVMGDMASYTNPGEERPLPGLAQVATSQGEGVACNIEQAVLGKPLKQYVYKHKGSLVSLGDWVAAGEIGRFKLFGHMTWWFWRTVYLFKLVSWQKKIQVMVDWTINLFTPRDISELYHCDRCGR